MPDASNPQPLSGNEMPRFGGIATFMRLPGRTDPADLDVAVVGVPFDIGTSNRPGARFGPRGIRDESVLLRPYNMATSGMTSLVGANLLYEMLCVLPGVQIRG